MGGVGGRWGVNGGPWVARGFERVRGGAGGGMGDNGGRWVARGGEGG